MSILALPPLPLNQDCSRNVTIDNCYALSVTLVDGSDVIAWRGQPGILRPTAGRLRDILPGDEVLVSGKPRVVRAVEIYR